MASKLKLFESDDDDSDPEKCELTINKEYAERYTARKEKEELQKLKEKYGDLSDYTSTSEDEEEVNWNSEFDKEWLRVYSAVKFKNKDIYDKEVQFVRDELEGEEDKDRKGEGSDSDTDSHSSASEESEEEAISKKKKKKKDGDRPLTIRDHERRVITDRNGMLSESEDDEEMKAQAMGPSYHEEQEAIRKSITKVMADMSSDDDDGDIFTHRVKSDKEKKTEEDEYLQFLKGNKDAAELKSRDKKIAKDLAPLRTFLSEGDEDTEAKKVVWNTLICRGALKEKADADDADEEEIEEESELKMMEENEEEFEHTYNFRFEEPDKNFIKQYKRNPEDTVRQEVNKRSQKRKEVQQRKKTVLEERREEIRRLRKLKRNELEGRLQLLMKECPSGVEFSPDDLTGDFNPQLYDKMMQEKFDNMHEDGDDEKPDLADLEDVLSIDSYEDIFEEEKSMADSTLGGEDEEEEEEEGTSGRGGSQANQEDSKVRVDAGYDPSWLPDMSRSTRKSRRRRKSKFQQALDAEKPVFTQVFEKYKNSATPWEDYVQEYYNLDYKEHGFRYRNVVSNDFGVHPGEMLWLPTRELNAWVSMKKVVEPKSESEEMYEKRKYQSAKMQRKILNVMPSLKKIEDEESNYEDIRPSILREKKMAQLAAQDDSDMSEWEERPAEEDLGSRLHTDSQSSPMKKKKGKASPGESPNTSSQASPMKKKKRKADLGESMEPDALPQKKKKKLKAGGCQLLNSSMTVQTDDQGREGKKKKKKLGFGVSEKNKATDNQPEVHTEGKKKKKLKSENNEAEVKGKKKEKVGGTTDSLSDETSKKKMKQQASDRQEQSQTSKQSGKKKLKGKKKKPKRPDGTPKVKGYIAKDLIQESRLAAFHIDPRKFRYTKDRIVPLQADQD